MIYFHNMVDSIHQKRIWRPWNQCGSICLHLRRHILNSRVHERHVTLSGHEGTPAWTKAAPSWLPGVARQHPQEFETNNTHTFMFDPLINVVTIAVFIIITAKKQPLYTS